MTRGIHWFRRDLRLRDNTALASLAACVDELVTVFVIDPRLTRSASSERPRDRFLFDCLERLGVDLTKQGIPLLTRLGHPEDVLPALAREADATVLSFGCGATPFARVRDDKVRQRLEQDGRRIIECRDDTVLAGTGIRSQSGRPYQVFTPYKKAWWHRFNDSARLPVAAPRLPRPIPTFGQEAPVKLRFAQTDNAPRLPTGGERAASRRLNSFLSTKVESYARDRDRPDLDGTSRLSPYLRFGAISPRECFKRALQTRLLRPETADGVDKWLDELIWREFYVDLALASPRILRGNARSEYDHLAWSDDPQGFAAWAEGRTGYPIVDAGMRQLRQTGWMHNRVRMIVASFLTKDLLIDWRQGENLFMELLVDGEPTSNNGGWQWAASTGSDAQPYFRIFNPVSQGRRYDPDGTYVRRFVPELREVPTEYLHAPWEMPAKLAPAAARSYPGPILDHAERRRIALDRFRNARAVRGIE